MSYPRDLEEYNEHELMTELERRRRLHAEGKCDYCGRRGDTNPCRFEHRHLAARRVLELLQLTKKEPV